MARDDRQGDGREYTTSTRPRVDNGDDSPTGGGRVGEVPHQPQNETGTEDTDHLQQVPETPPSEDDGNEGDSEDEGSKVGSQEGLVGSECVCVCVCV